MTDIETYDTANIEADGYPGYARIFYDRGVWTIGEDGDQGLMVQGHGRRAMAAFNAYQRDLHGVGWDWSIAYGTRDIWVLVATECGCTPELHATEHVDEHGFPTRDCGCEFWGLPPCTKGMFMWAWREVDADTPGAVALTEVTW